MLGQTADGIYICSALNIDLELIRYPLPESFLTAHMTWSAVSAEREREGEMLCNWTLPAGHLCHLPDESIRRRDGLCK